MFCIPSEEGDLGPQAAEFIRRGRTNVPLVSSSLAREAVTGIRRLIEDPDRDRWTLEISRDGEPDDEPDDGLIRKTSSGGEDKDDKWLFHYRSSLRSHLADYSVHTSAHEDLLTVCTRLHAICLEQALTFADAFDGALPGHDLVRRIRDAGDLHVLRILRYDRGIHIARAHTDRACLTLQIAESRPALRLGDTRESFRSVPDEALLFAGQKLERLTRGLIPALVHDVVDPTNGTAEDRWAVIFFAHIRNTDH